jgi:hypothetical protein
MSDDDRKKKGKKKINKRNFFIMGCMVMIERKWKKQKVYEKKVNKD